jgi:hypothetical protein
MEIVLQNGKFPWEFRGTGRRPGKIKIKVSQGMEIVQEINRSVV